MALSASRLGVQLGDDMQCVVCDSGRLDRLNRAELYDRATVRCSETGSMFAARVRHTATLLPSGKVLVVGGLGGSNGAPRDLAYAELYDPATGKWHPARKLRALRSRERDLERDRDA